MCGIVGSFPVADEKTIKTGLEKIKHRGPDAQQMLVTSSGSFGHARLSILDVTGGAQPMSDGKRWIVFNGEIYNYQQLRRRFIAPWQNNSDTEVVLRCYAAYGMDCPKHLDGMFAFAILDGDDLFMARDPLGIKPLYYAQTGGKLYFASEIKALLPFTSEIHEFPPGCCWHSRRGFRVYDSFERLRHAAVYDPSKNPTKEIKHVYDLLLKAVTKRLIADEGVPVGISLSGGLDSSIIAALTRLARDRVDSFAVGMEGSEDLPASFLMSKFLGTNHHTYIYSLEDMLQALPEIIYSLKSYDAALVRSAIPNYFLSKLASDYVKVILTGEGADELFAGYAYLKPITLPGKLREELLTITGNLHNTNLQRTDRMTMAHGIEGRVPFLDRDFVDMAFDLPDEWKIQGKGHLEKELLRKSFSEALPEEIAWRPKQKFSQGTGSADLIAEYANQTISDEAYLAEKKASKEAGLRSKEELLYYRIFTGQFSDQIPTGVIGRTRSVTQNELN